MSETQVASSPKSVKSFEVEQLFGKFDYRIPALEPASEKGLLLLYGDNGSGKTTLLSLLHHMLSSHPKSGHRSYLARTPYKRFRVTFNDGHAVETRRPGVDLTGGFIYEFWRPGSDKPSARYEFAAKPDGSDTKLLPEKIEDSDKAGALKKFEFLWNLTPPKYEEFYRDLRDFAPAVFLLTDQRQLLADALQPAAQEAAVDEDDLDVISPRRIPVSGDIHPTTSFLLKESLDVLENSFRVGALVGSRAGDDSVHRLYLTIVERLARPWPSEGQPPEGMEQLALALEQQGKRNADFAAFGLTQEVDYSALLKLARGAPPGARHVVGEVLSAYLESLRARLDALAPVRERMATFKSVAESFLSRKSLVVDVRKGLYVLDLLSGHPLRPEQLSSGERQLLLLFANLTIARQGAALFLVDEPEISLNVKWQRNFLDAALRLVEGSAVQLIMATHSIEMLSRFTDSVTQLPR